MNLILIHHNLQFLKAQYDIVMQVMFHFQMPIEPLCKQDFSENYLLGNSNDHLFQFVTNNSKSLLYNVQEYSRNLY